MIFLVPIAFIALVIFIIVASAQAQKQRTEALQVHAEELGLTFTSEGGGPLEGQLSKFYLMQRGRARKYRNVIVADTPDVKISIFDYQFTVGSGKNRHTRRQTVAAIQSSNLDMPSFRARPEGVFDSIGGVLGFQDIDFDDHPQFSDTFVLKSDVEEKTRQFFDHGLLDFFCYKSKLCFEANGGTFFFYELGHCVRPVNLKNLLEDSYRTYGALRDRTSRS